MCLNNTSVKLNTTPYYFILFFIKSYVTLIKSKRTMILDYTSAFQMDLKFNGQLTTQKKKIKLTSILLLSLIISHHILF
jgi:hypothetical protein